MRTIIDLLAGLAWIGGLAFIFIGDPILSAALTLSGIFLLLYNQRYTD